MSEPKASADAYTDAATDLYVRLLPLRDRARAAEARLRRILANAGRDGHSPSAIDETAFERATARIAARTGRGDADADTMTGLDGTPLGSLLIAKDHV